MGGPGSEDSHQCERNFFKFHIMGFPPSPSYWCSKHFLTKAELSLYIKDQTEIFDSEKNFKKSSKFYCLNIIFS